MSTAILTSNTIILDVESPQVADRVYGYLQGLSTKNRKEGSSKKLFQGINKSSDEKHISIGIVQSNKTLRIEQLYAIEAVLKTFEGCSCSTPTKEGLILKEISRLRGELIQNIYEEKSKKLSKTASVIADAVWDCVVTDSSPASLQDAYYFNKRREDKIKELDALDALKLASNNIYMFLCGLNIQDHSLQDQRKIRELLNNLRAALLDCGVGNDEKKGK